ncbi:hypothetical protein MPSEU_000834500 [Mayamaea pseudoterrestris]|nr:hypothetical protein MPSEU_000834500 [Mayamaea pseudoterrestris]
MGGSGNVAKEHPLEYFGASFIAASINYPLWRVSSIGQSGFVIANEHMAGNFAANVPGVMRPYLYAFQPPYKGMLATVGGMTWARAAIFYTSDVGRDYMRAQFKEGGYTRNVNTESLSTVVPPLIISTIVQIMNQPLVRATITLQDPNQKLCNTREALKHIYKHHGLQGLWHGTSAGILKTVPKYSTAVIIKDFVHEYLPEPDPASPNYEREQLTKSAYKAVAAGVAGAVLSNPLDVARNEMFKTHRGLTDTVRQLHAEMGMAFLWRGMGKNTIAVAIPVACTIFLTDAFIAMSKASESSK